ncbi:MAG: hypothetical protein MI923_15330 [Phycisphaerales bacterium]|nr:hypothetical protein [Phycisphaerales bacterium]
MEKVNILNLYVGLPNQEHASIRGNIANLVGQILSIVKRRSRRIRKHPGRSEPQPLDSFVSLIPGATFYNSAIGAWMNNARRVDDHVQVIEFLLEPDDFQASALLIFSEVVFPTLVLAEQDEILGALHQHHEVSGFRFARKAAVLRRAKPGTEPSRDEDRRLLHPIRFLMCLTDFALQDSESMDLDHEWQSWTAPWWEWVSRTGIEKTEYWDESIRPHNYEPTSVFKDFDLGLPTVYFRVLIHTASWWLFYTSSETLLDSAEHFARYLFTHRVGQRLHERLGKALKWAEKTYFDKEEKKEKNGYFSKLRVGPESEDPLPNAVLWLSFLYDYLAEWLAIHYQPPRADWEIRQGWSSRAPGSKEWFFPKIARKLRVAKEDPASTPDDWRRYLEVLLKVDDRHFPDSHLLDAWETYFRIVSKPDKKGMCWADEVTAAQIDQPWWAATYRSWRVSNPCAQLWLAPLMLDAVHRAVRKRYKSKSKINKTLDLDYLFDLSQQKTKSNGSWQCDTLRRLVEDAFRAFPIDLPDGDRKNASALIFAMQQSV